MVRVLLVLDDYNELTYLQTVLRKIGFDVDGLQNTKKFTDVRLGFNPQVIIMTLVGNKVNGIELAQSVKKVHDMPVIVGLTSPNMNISMDDLGDVGVNYILESPVNQKLLMEILSDAGNVDIQILLEKLAKLRGQENGEAVGEDSDTDYYEQELGLYEVSGEAPKAPNPEKISSAKDFKAKTTLTAEDRVLKYQEFLKTVDDLKDKSKSFDSSVIKKFNKSIRESRKKDENIDVDKSRRAFVKALFTKEES